MAKSILQTAKECYICGSRSGLECHHVIHGTSNRKNSEKYGLKIWLCWTHHKIVHEDRATDLALMRMAQRKFEEIHTREEFMAVFGKNWLD